MINDKNWIFGYVDTAHHWKKILHALAYGSCNCQEHLLSGFGARTSDDGHREPAEEHQKEEKTAQLLPKLHSRYPYANCVDL